LAKSWNQLLQNLETLLTGVSPKDILEELQDVLLQADLGVQTAEDIVQEVASLRADSTKMLNKDDLKSIMRGKLIEALETDSPDSSSSSAAIQFSQDPNVPTILLIIGANGMGKTTTIGKLAHRLMNEGNQTVLMAACDTFRAGAVEQLQQWAYRAGCDLVGPDEQVTKTPAAVLYKALDVAMTPKKVEVVQEDGSTRTVESPFSYDTILVDTSGRLSNNDALTAELVKMKRVIQKRFSLENDPETGKPVFNTNVPHETLLVLDAAQGRMALDSAKVWNAEIGLSGLILTKLDGSARGGSVVAVSRDLQLPVKLVGVGEGIEDLKDVSVVCLDVFISS
jgi:fused signal recognition particle receptor